MSGALTVAIVAVVIATGSLLWQVFQWIHARRPHIEVEVQASFLVFGSDLVDAVTVKAINRSDHAVRVGSLGLYTQDGSGRTIQPVFQEVPGATIPGVVASHDAGESYFELGELESHPQAPFDRYRPLSGWVTLATGETITSKPRTIWSR